MKPIQPMVMVFVLWALAAGAAVRRAADEGFSPLFDGKSLTGWHGDPAVWSVSDGAILGSTDRHEIKHNTFLVSDKKYKNFVLRLKFKLRNWNSGVQFRSQEFDDYVVRGYQADMADKQFMGILYDEGGKRGILQAVDQEKLKPHLKSGNWNEYVITADGPHITQAINGYTTVDFNDTDAGAAKEGVIALQLHTGPKMQVMFKDIEIKELP